MTKSQMIEYIRLNLGAEDVGSTNALLILSDAQIELYLNVVASRDFPQILPLNDIPGDCVYAISLLTRIEIYYFLATTTAPEYQLKTDGGATLSKEQKFDHYSSLISQTQSLYNDFIATGGAGGAGNTLTSYDITLPNRYYTSYNYSHSIEPVVSVTIDTVGDTHIDISWTYSCAHFYKTRVYIGTDLTYDAYVDNDLSSYLVKEYTNPFANKLRLLNLTPNTQYSIIVEVIDLTTRKGYCSKTFTTQVEGGVDIVSV